MLAPTDRTIVLRVQLDEADTEKKLGQLTLDLEATRKAQAALTAERKAGKVSDEQFAQQTVALKTQLTAQRTEYAALEKNLSLYRQAQNGEVNSYQATQAALSLAIRQQQQLAGSADDSTEASQALTQQIAAYREQLAQTDEKQNAFFRRIGDYGRGTAGLKELTQQLVQLEEEQKRFVMGSDQELKVRNQIGFLQTAAIQKAAQEGQSYEQAQNFIRQYGEAIRPATADLVQLAEQQQAAAESGEATGEAMQAIGFKIGQARKSIQDTTKALAEVPTQAAPAQQGLAGFGGTIAELDGTTGAFGGQVANLKQRFATAKQGIDLAKGGFTGLKGAIASTGIGVLILALGALYEYFTKTDEGSEDLAAGLAFLKGLFAPLATAALETGRFLVKVFTDPKEAGQQLLDFIEGQVVNRVKALGVIFEALKNGDFKQAANGVLQYATGVEDVIGKTKALAAESKRAADAAYTISRAKDALEDSERAEIVRTEKTKNLIDKLVLSAKDRTLTEQQRLANLDRAGKLETQMLERTTGLAKERLRIQLLENKEAEQRGTISDEQRTAAEEAAAALERLSGQSATLQQAIQNRRSVLLQQEANDAKQAAAQALAAATKAAELRLKQRRESLVLESQLLDRQIKQVKAGSDEELSLQQQKLRAAYQSELAQKDLTVRAKLQLDRKYEDDSLALTVDFQRRRLLAALQAEADIAAAQLAQQRSGEQGAAATALRLQAEQIEKQKSLALAGLDERGQNEAKVAALNAQAANQQRQLEYQEATRLLGTYLADKKRAVENDYADGLIKEGEYQRRLAAIAKAGTDAQTVINQDYQQTNAANQQQADEQDTAARRQHTADVKREEEVKQQLSEARVQTAQQATEAVIALFGEESAAGQAALVIRKTLALAEIAINLQKQLSLNHTAAAELSVIPIVGPGLAIAYEVTQDALAIAAAAAGVAAVLKLQRGGLAHVGGGLVATGPSHAQGGIPLYHRGQPAGIEIEGMEPVLTANVTRNPLLLSLASTVNQLAGGRALTPNLPSYNFAALGAITRPVAIQQLRAGAAEGLDYDRLAQALGKLQVKATISDVKAGLERDRQTQRLANS